MKGENIILFDGMCNLCNGFVQFVIRNDPKAIFQFASLESDFGQKALLEQGLHPETFDSILLRQNGKIYQKSTAVFKIFRKLKFPLNLLAGFLFLPRFLRDHFYTIVSKKRYQILGKTDRCMRLDPSLRKRFL